jgi:predicted  nucleic acid-binding Zn-ribbon protein
MPADLDTLHQLWKLHQIDKRIVEIRSRAAALDPGRRLQAEIDALNKEFESKKAEVDDLAGELADLELKQKGFDEKIKKFDKQLYGGNLVNPREVENMQKEIAMLKRQRGELDVRVLELWEIVPVAREAAAKAKAAAKERRGELNEYQKKVLVSKGELEAAFKEASGRRAAIAAEVEPGLLRRYETIRQKHGGIGMSRLLKAGSCEMCGTLQPRKTIELVKEGQAMTCESCHRILYFTESIA